MLLRAEEPAGCCQPCARRTLSRMAAVQRGLGGYLPHPRTRMFTICGPFDLDPPPRLARGREKNPRVSNSNSLESSNEWVVRTSKWANEPCSALVLRCCACDYGSGVRQIERNQNVRGATTGDVQRTTWTHHTESALDVVRWVHVAPLTEVSSGYILFDKKE